MWESLLLVFSDSDTGSKLREWSSLIGIVTAIIGNILISFALNIQRYAHLRLAREQEQQQTWNATHTINGQKGYGTQQSDIAEDRIKANLTARLDDGPPLNDHNPTEEYTHVPGAHNESLHSRSSSESTIKQLEKPKTFPEKKTYLKSPYWWTGIILMIAGEAGNFIAYGFAPASIVSPLGVVALISNCIIAPCLLHERFRQRDLWGVVVAVGGAVTIVLSAKNSEVKMGPGDVWAAITRWEFETYLGITAALIIVLIWASGRYGEKTILIDLGLVALCGGYTALSTKGVASLLSDTLWRALTFPITYLLVFILVVSALAQIRYVNRALQRFDSTQVIPVQFVLFTISVIIGSAVLYRDFQAADASRIGKFFGGCALTFLGVYLITSGRAGNDSEGDTDDYDNEENTIGLVDEERYQDDIDKNQGNTARRKSSVSFAFDGPNGSRRSSKQQANRRRSSTRTPPRLLS
ncbi:magnesium transporter NIPA-domain-containing protein, partial [Usnea florida]